MTCFVIHYPQMCRLAEVYPYVQNQHLRALMVDAQNSDYQLGLQLKRQGAEQDSNYGW